MSTAWSRAFRSADGVPTGLDRLVRPAHQLYDSCAKNCVATVVTAFFASNCAELPGVLKGPCEAGVGPVVGQKNDAKF
jgi:hypothetical protein